MDGDAIGLPELLGLMGFAAPWKFDGMFIDRELGHFELRFSCPRGTRHHCTECGVMDQPAHDFLDMVWEHERFLGYRCFIRARVPRTRCGHCGAVRRAEVPWARPDSGFTLQFEALQLHMCRQAPVKSVSDLMGLGDDRLRRVIAHYVPRAVSLEDLGRVRRIGIDEKSIKKGHKYMTVFMDWDACRVIYMCEGRGSETIARFVEHLEAHGGSRDSIGWACIDMSPAYISGMAKHLPGAKVVFDKFHVVQLANRAMEAVRRLEQQGGVEDLKRTRWLWLMDGDDLSPEQVALVAALVRKRLKTARAFMIKEALRAILSNRHLSRAEAKAALGKWLAWAQRSRLEAFVELGRTVKKHLDGILAIFESGGMSNGPLEAINGLIHVALGRARGFRNLDYLMNVVYLVAGRLRHLPPSPWGTAPYDRSAVWSRVLFDPVPASS